MRRQEAEKEERLREEEEKERKEEERRLASEEEEENERRLEAATTKVLERQKRLEGGTDVTMEEENLVKKEEETLESVRRQMEMVLVEGEAEMPDTESVADIVAAEYVKQLAVCPSTSEKRENGDASHQNLVQSDPIEERRPPELAKAVETARDSTESGHLELESKVVSPVYEGSMETKLTDAEKVGDQRSKESHIDASLEKEDTGSKSNVRENLEEEKQTLEKLTDIRGSPTSQHPGAGDTACGR